MYQIVFSLLGGDLERGFPVVTAQIWENQQSYPIKLTGSLPAAPELSELYRRWQTLYAALLRRLNRHSRIKVDSTLVTHVSIADFDEVCQQLRLAINMWLNADSFQKIERQLRTRLNREADLQIVIETDVALLHRLPWQLWNFFEDYPNAEVALSLQNQAPPPGSSNLPTGKVKILAILGNSDHIDVQGDRAMLEQLTGAQTTVLAEPNRQDFNDQLWNQGWDILFFAGHSDSQGEKEIGLLHLNTTDSLTIPQLRHALKAAIAHGLKVAIFNSCDGIGLARDLADLHISQIVVMREPVPDQVAQVFLKHFLAAFSRGEPFYTAIREARERLQGLENDFPCASWLPVICQNPTIAPSTWQELRGASQTTPLKQINQNNQLGVRRSRSALLMSSMITTAVLGLRFLGALQPLELRAFDQMLRLRQLEHEPQDPHILVVKVTEADIKSRSQETRRGLKSLSDRSLALLLQQLNRHKPLLIGLDLYRDTMDDSQPAGQADLMAQLNQDNVIVACKSSDKVADAEGIKPPDNVPQERQGFTDVQPDGDRVLRRQILSMQQEPSSRCTTPSSLSFLLASRYLFEVYQNQSGDDAAKNVLPQFTSDGELTLGSTLFQRLKTGYSGAYQREDLNGIQILLNYRASDYEEVTLGQVLQGKVNPDSIRDKLVLVGVTANSARDVWQTPYGNQSGVVVQAGMVSQIVNAVLSKRPLLWVLPDWSNLLWICGWSVASGLVVWRIRSRFWQGGAIILTTTLLYGTCATMLLTRGAWLPFVPAAISLIGSGGAVIMNTRVQDTSSSGSVRAR